MYEFDLVLPTAVDVREVGMRDGLQLEAPVPLEAKLEMLEALVATGVRRIEATSFVSPKAVPALADAEQVAAELSRWGDVHWSALVANPRGAVRAVDAGWPNLEYVVSASDGHSQANAGRSTAEAVAAVGEIAELAHGAGGSLEVIIATAWDCPFDGRTPIPRTVDVARAAVTAGADQLCLGDTIGTTTPLRVVQLLDAVHRACPGVPLGVHFHDTRGTGQANALAAVQAGVTQLDASIGGLGGCPFAPGASGNIATEELVYMLEESGVHTGLDLDAVLAAARVTEQAVGHELPSSLYRAGGRSVPRAAELGRRRADGDHRGSSTPRRCGTCSATSRPASPSSPRFPTTGRSASPASRSARCRSTRRWSRSPPPARRGPGRTCARSAGSASTCSPKARTTCRSGSPAEGRTSSTASPGCPARTARRCWRAWWPGSTRELWAEYDGGDHTIAVARVLDLGAHPDRRPLLYHRGSYGLLRSSEV